MKFNGTSKKDDGKYVKIDGKWYTMPDNVKKYVLAQKFQDGDEINIKSEMQGETSILTFIEKIGGGSTTTGSPNTGTTTQTRSYGSKTPEERLEIKKQAVMKAVCHAISGCQGIDANTIGDVIVSVFDKAFAKVNE